MPKRTRRLDATTRPARRRASSALSPTAPTRRRASAARTWCALAWCALAWCALAWGALCGSGCAGWTHAASDSSCQPDAGPGPSAQAQRQAQRQAGALRVTTSQTLSLLYTAESLIESSGRSGVGRQLMLERAPGPSAQAAALIREALRGAPELIRFHEGEPGRVQGQRFLDLLEVVASQSSSLVDFEERSRPLLPLASHDALVRGLRLLEQPHREHLWEPAQPWLSQGLASLAANLASHDAEGFLRRVAHLYGSAWPSQAPLTLALVPVPAKSRREPRLAHAANAYGVVELHPDHDQDELLGVAVHELCHVLYDAQPLERQRQLARWMNDDPRLGSLYAQGELDEALATALGNGLFEQAARGGADTRTSWYDDAIIDAYARAIAPQVRAWLERGKPWDEALTRALLEAYHETFPDHARDPRQVFQQVQLLIESRRQDADLAGLHRGLRRVRGVEVAQPLSDARAVTMYASAPNTTAIFVMTSASLEALRAYPFYERLSAKLTPAQIKTPMIWATRGLDHGRLHVFLFLGGRAGALGPWYAQLGASARLPMERPWPLGQGRD